MKIKKYLDAFLKLLLFSAMVHVVLLTIFSIINLNVKKINYFDILDLDLFFPNMFGSESMQAVSLILLVFIYFIILKFFTSDEK